MNTDDGRIYRSAEDIAAARERGEPLVEVSEEVALLMEEGRESRKARHAEMQSILRQITSQGKRRY